MANPIDSHHSYRTLDRIENLKIRVKIYRKSDQMILVDELEARWQQGISLLDNPSTPKDIEDSSESPLSAAGSVSNKSPKRSKSASKKQRFRKRRLYTLVNEDKNFENFVGSVEKLNLSQNFSSPSIKSSKGLERALEPLQSVTTYLGKVEQDLFAADNQEILGLANPKKNRWSQIHRTSVYSEMVFGVSLPAKSRMPDGPSDIVEQVDTSQDVERVICKIQYYGSGNFSISPNFTNREAKEMHQIHIGDDTYLYTIENASDALSQENEKKEKLIFEEFFKRQHTLRMDKLTGQLFEGLPDDSFYQRYCVNGEITSCTGFQSDTLYCQYLIDVPSEWTTDERHTNLLSAYTQVSYATILQGELDRTAFFGYPIEVSLVSRDKSPKPVKVYVKVYSIDSGDRHCIEGYGYTLLPLEAGSVDFQVNTWRPLFDFREQTKSFFLGGSPDLLDFKFDNTEDMKKPLNRYGLQTEASGSIKMKFNIITQVDNPELRKLASSTLSTVPEKLLAETNYALERAKLRLQTLKSLDAASSAEQQ